MSKHRIVSMDGGSITGNGFVTAGLLQAMQLALGDSASAAFLDHVALFAGTSAGAFNAAFLARWEHPSESLPQIQEFWTAITNAESPKNGISLCRLAQAIAGKAAFIATGTLHSYFQDYFGTMRLGDLKQRVAIASFQLDSGNPKLRTWKPKIFNNYPGDPDCDEKVADVVMRSGSPPLINPVYQGYVDGGVVSNNPSMIALAEVLFRHKAGPTQTIPEVLMLSIGNATVPKYLETPPGETFTDWGYQKWLLDPQNRLALVTMFMESSTLAVNYECARLLDDAFFRIDPYLSKPLDVANGSQVVPAVQKVLVDPVTQKEITAAVEWLHSSGWIAPTGSYTKKQPE
ncbi:MAG TPA: patatin-like phospholipase family protein [Terracidiphilus sp.]|nr:patatin-like phospholipase family protein [Terracidiphilus sp.]